MFDNNLTSQCNASERDIRIIHEVCRDRWRSTHLSGAIVRTGYVLAAVVKRHMSCCWTRTTCQSCDTANPWTTSTVRQQHAQNASDRYPLMRLEKQMRKKRCQVTFHHRRSIDHLGRAKAQSTEDLHRITVSSCIIKSASTQVRNTTI
jgi:hypothetical protein